jgi:hypothetical protein
LSNESVRREGGDSLKVGRIAPHHSSLAAYSGTPKSVFKIAAIAAGINAEKALLRRGQPSRIVEQRDPIELLKALHDKHPNLVQIVPELEGIAEEIPDPQLGGGC